MMPYVTFDDFMKQIAFYFDDNYYGTLKSSITHHLAYYILCNYEDAFYFHNKETDSYDPVQGADYKSRRLYGDDQVVLEELYKAIDNASVVLNGRFCDTDKPKEIYDNYIPKKGGDYSAADVAQLAVSRPGIPPIKDKDLDNLEKFVLNNFMHPQKNPVFSQRVYLKKTKKNHSVFCVDFATAQDIISDANFLKSLDYRSAKAEHKMTNLEKEVLALEQASIDAFQIDDKQENIPLHSDYDKAEYSFSNTDRRKMYLMTEAIYSLFFSDFDFEKFFNDEDSMANANATLKYSSDDVRILHDLTEHSSNQEYYKIDLSPVLIDAIADRLSDKIADILTGR